MGRCLLASPELTPISRKYDFRLFDVEFFAGLFLQHTSTHTFSKSSGCSNSCLWPRSLASLARIKNMLEPLYGGSSSRRSCVTLYSSFLRKSRQGIAHVASFSFLGDKKKMLHAVVMDFLSGCRSCDSVKLLRALIMSSLRALHLKSTWDRHMKGSACRPTLSPLGLADLPKLEEEGFMFSGLLLWPFGQKKKLLEPIHGVLRRTLCQC